MVNKKYIQDPNNPNASVPNPFYKESTSKSTYSGASIVDYLKSVGQASDYSSRAKMASQQGITGYKGTAEQNTRLLGVLRGGASASVPVSPQVSSQPTTSQTGSTLPFPKNQVEMASYQDRKAKGEIEFVGGKWQTKTGTSVKPTLETISKGVSDVASRTQALVQRVKTEGITRAGDAGGAEDAGDTNTLADLGLDDVDTGFTVSDQARRTKIEEEAKETFGDTVVGDKPALPTYEADFEAMRSEKGITALETRMSDVDAEIRELEDQTRADLRDEEGKLRPMSLIATHQQEILRDRQEQIDALNRSKAIIVDEYNTKVSLINQMMKLKQMDYNASVADYNASFSKALQIQSLIESRVSKAEQIKNQQSDNARANLSVVAKAMTDSGKIWDELDPNLQATISKLELQAGVPVGVTQEFYNSYPDDEVVTQTKGTDASGQEFVSFITKDKNGNYSVKNVYTRGVSKAATSAQIKKAGLLVSVGNASYDISTVMGIKGALGVGASEAEIYAALDTKTTLTKTAISKLMDEAMEKRTWSDINIKSYISDSYKAGSSREDIKSSIEFDEKMSAFDKKEAIKKLSDMIPNELNNWLKKVSSQPDKYKIEDDGVYEIKKWWKDKKVYSF